MLNRKQIIFGISILVANSTVSAMATPHVSWSGALGLGYNSNVYQSPSASYADIAQATAPTVNPDVQSGFFIPLIGKVNYENQLNKKIEVDAQYRLKALRYLDSKLNNANVTKHHIEAGGQYIFKQKKSRKDSLYAGVFIDNVKQLYVDRDSGSDKLSGTTNISERYHYSSLGLKLEYKNRTGAIQYGAAWMTKTSDYVDTVAVSQYDNTYQKLSADVEFRLAKPTKLNLDISLANRDYDERPSRELNGSLPATNPARKYGYTSLGSTVRHKINKNWVAFGSYIYGTREDKHVGYNSYTSHKISGRLLHKTDTARTRAEIAYKTLDYDNALAYEDVAGGLKTYSSIEAKLSTEVPRGKHQAIVGDFKYKAVDTNDARYKYDLFIIAAGYKWEY